jgi:hypothetical protein
MLALGIDIDIDIRKFTTCPFNPSLRGIIQLSTTICDDEDCLERLQTLHCATRSTPDPVMPLDLHPHAYHRISVVIHSAS